MTGKAIAAAWVPAAITPSILLAVSSLIESSSWTRTSIVSSSSSSERKSGLVQDALLDLRQVVREGRAIWLQLSEYAPREPQEPDEAPGGRVGPNEQETQP